MNNDLRTVIGFSLRNKLKTKSFVITTLIIAILLSIGIHIPFFIQQFSSESQPTALGMIDNSEVSSALSQYFEQQESPSLRIKLVAPAASAAEDEQALKNMIADGEIKAYLILEENPELGFPKVFYKSESTSFSASADLTLALQAVKNELLIQELGLTKDQLNLLNMPVQLETMQVSAVQGAGSIGEGKTNEQVGMSIAIVYVTVILLFMGIMMSGQLIASEITSEKSSRIMEVLITSVSPLKQMFGKIFAMFIVGLAQILFYILVGIFNLMLPWNNELISEFNINWSDVDPLLIVYAAIFYFLGYFLFTTLYAAIGSIVSRTEDLGQAIMPITFLSLGAFYVAIFGMMNAGTPFMVTMSFIPFFTPFVMFVRIGVTDPAIWEVWLSIGILLASTLFLGWLSAKIYRTGVLMYGKRPTIKELRKAMKAYKI